MITIRASLKGVQALIDKFEATGEQIFAARRAAINETVKGLRVDAGKIIRETVQITKVPNSPKTPKKIVESRIKLNFAKGNSATGGKLVIQDNKIPIRWFGPKENPKPSKGKKRRSRKKTVSTVKILKGGSRQVLPKAFGANNQKLGYTFWQRASKAAYPLLNVEGVDVADLIRKRGGERRLKESANTRMQKNMTRRFKNLKFTKARRNQK
jgi:hypothetical protein